MWFQIMIVLNKLIPRTTLYFLVYRYENEYMTKISKSDIDFNSSRYVTEYQLMISL